MEDKEERNSQANSYLLDVVLLQGLSCTIDSILLHLFAHVSVLDHGLSITHFVVLDCLEDA